MSEPQLIRQAIPAEAAARFTARVWDDIKRQRVTFSTHGSDLLRKNALEFHGSRYPLLLALHWGLTRMASDRFGADLLPSFAYLRVYYAGEILRVHSDREACEVSLSLALDSSDRLPWPLSVGRALVGDKPPTTDDFGDEPFDSYPLLPGDGLLYQGSRHRHGRLEPNPNRWSAHAFFMWVRKDGPHRDAAFERVGLDMKDATPAD